jgi:hypothetical protein
MHDDDDTASWVTAIVTIANYALLIAMGFLRDLMFGKGRRDTPGYAPLLNDWQVLSCDSHGNLKNLACFQKKTEACISVGFLHPPPLQPHPCLLDILSKLYELTTRHSTNIEN